MRHSFGEIVQPFQGSHRGVSVSQGAHSRPWAVLYDPFRVQGDKAGMLGSSQGRKSTARRAMMWRSRYSRTAAAEQPISKNQEPKVLLFNWFLEFGSWFLFAKAG